MGPWTKRITDLKEACGWSQGTTAEKLGIGKEKLKSVLAGTGKAKADMIVRLASLEKYYGEQIEAYRNGLILRRGKGHARPFDFRPVRPHQSGRPEDLKALE